MAQRITKHDIRAAAARVNKQLEQAGASVRLWAGMAYGCHYVELAYEDLHGQLDGISMATAREAWSYVKGWEQALAELGELVV